MKFGISQITKQSPLVISRLKRALNFFSFGVLVYSPIMCDKLGMDFEEFTMWLGFWGLLLNTIGIMFGVDPTEDNSPKKDNE